MAAVLDAILSRVGIPLADGRAGDLCVRRSGGSAQAPGRDVTVPLEAVGTPWAGARGDRDCLDVVIVGAGNHGREQTPIHAWRGGWLDTSSWLKRAPGAARGRRGLLPRAEGIPPLVCEGRNSGFSSRRST